MKWTVEKVKEVLPDVRVRQNKLTTVICRLSGRKNEFATVTLPDGSSFQVAWVTVVYVLNTGSAIRL